MEYVLKQTGRNGWFVKRPGEPRVYCADVWDAHKFATRAEADRERRVDDEVVLPFDGMGFT